MADRGPVKIREGNIKRLVELYKKTYLRLVKEISRSTTAGKISKARVMARINAELQVLGIDINKIVEKELPQYYLDGSNVALQDLRALGLEVESTKKIALINKEAIKALTDDTALYFAESITTISRNAQRAVTDALKLQLNFTIAEGKLRGDTRRQISKVVVKQLEDRGIGAMIDARGRQWSFENYAEMLVRTKAVEARNQGLVNTMLINGYDLVQVSRHSDSCRLCDPFQGKILSISGSTKKGTKLPGGFVVFASLEEAKARGLFHPRCRHSINVINPSIAAKTKIYDYKTGKYVSSLKLSR